MRSNGSAPAVLRNSSGCCIKPSCLAQGIVAAPVSVVSGTLAAASKVTEGVDATTRNLRGAAATAVGAKKLGAARKRLQRAFTGEGVFCYTAQTTI